MNATNIDFGYEMAQRIGTMFYIVKPTIYKDVQHVPNFMHRVSYFISFTLCFVNFSFIKYNKDLI
jgi:hypothetical protein